MPRRVTEVSVEQEREISEKSETASARARPQRVVGCLMLFVGDYQDKGKDINHWRVRLGWSGEKKRRRVRYRYEAVGNPIQSGDDALLPQRRRYVWVFETGEWVDKANMLKERAEKALKARQEEKTQQAAVLAAQEATKTEREKRQERRREKPAIKRKETDLDKGPPKRTPALATTAVVTTAAIMEGRGGLGRRGKAGRLAIGLNPGAGRQDDEETAGIEAERDDGAGSSPLFKTDTGTDRNGTVTAAKVPSVKKRGEEDD